MVAKKKKSSSSKSKKNDTSLTFEFMQFNEMSTLNTPEKIKKVLSVVKENKILLLEGRFKKQEEAQLIQETMGSINNKFKGIEIAIINPPDVHSGVWAKLKSSFVSLLLGEREGFTLIGPATIIKDIKQNPHKLNQLSLNLMK